MNNWFDVRDRISDLTDPIIHHIFSFLDTRGVIQTSILSNRWRYLWSSSPFLSFHFMPNVSTLDRKQRKLLTNFVDRVLICRDSCTIHKFSITSDIKLDGNHLYTWLIGALKRNVQELHLQINLDETFELPQAIFTSKITVLNLSAILGKIGFRLPNAICLASKIKSMGLEYVKLPNGNSNRELVFTFPVLGKLIMRSCEDSHLKMLTIVAPSLKRLDFIQECDGGCKVSVCCPKLISILWSSFEFGGCSSADLSALISADINIWGWMDNETSKEPYDQCLIKCLKGICNITALNLSASTIKDIANSPSILEMLPNVFCNLRNILLEEGAEDGGITSICAILKVLKTLPSVQAFVWDRRKCTSCNLTKGGDDEGDDLPANCIFYCLKTVEIRNPSGAEDEFKFLGLLLERAIFLKEMIITTTLHRWEQFGHKLLTLPPSFFNRHIVI